MSVHHPEDSRSQSARPPTPPPGSCMSTCVDVDGGGDDGDVYHDAVDENNVYDFGILWVIAIDGYCGACVPCAAHFSRAYREAGSGF